MGRAGRIEYEGELYHLMFRGNNGQDIYSLLKGENYYGVIAQPS